MTLAILIIGSHSQTGSERLVYFWERHIWSGQPHGFVFSGGALWASANHVLLPIVLIANVTDIYLVLNQFMNNNPASYSFAPTIYSNDGFAPTTSLSRLVAATLLLCRCCCSPPHPQPQPKPQAQAQQQPQHAGAMWCQANISTSSTTYKHVMWIRVNRDATHTYQQITCICPKWWTDTTAKMF